eukprot:8825426-Pyramimonas_sp.AAC.1
MTTYAMVWKNSASNASRNETAVPMLFSTTSLRTLGQRNMIRKIREARSLMFQSDSASIKKWRELNETIWDYWANDFPSY